MASLKRLLPNSLQHFLKEIRNHKPVYFILFTILTLATFIRVYRLPDLLGFYYDQGRDALVIQQILHGKPTLIGPTTGIEGIFLGPFFYYLLTPFYFFSSGDPTGAAIELAIINTLAILLVFLLGKDMFGYFTGLIASFLLAFSYTMVQFSRWLANPSPLPFFGILFFLAIFKVQKGNHWWLPVGAVALALSLQLEAAGAILFFPSAIVFFLIFRRSIPTWRILALSLATFLILISPQFLFDLRHDFLISKKLISFFEGSSGQNGGFLVLPNSFQLNQRLELYKNFFGSLLTVNVSFLTVLFLICLGVAAIKYFLFSPKNRLAIGWILIWLIVPVFGYFFYQGNYGYLWSYYLLGQYPIFFLLIGAVAQKWWKIFPIRIAIISLLFTFLFVNAGFLKNYLASGLDGKTTITFGNQKKIIDFIYQNAAGRDFNVDVYVPPVISYAYDYLFLWHGQKKSGYQPKKEHVPLLYTVYEVDPPHPERLQTWLDRMDTIGKITGQEQRFGGIYVQKRLRL